MRDDVIVCFLSASSLGSPVVQCQPQLSRLSVFSVEAFPTAIQCLQLQLVVFLSALTSLVIVEVGISIC